MAQMSKCVLFERSLQWNKGKLVPPTLRRYQDLSMMKSIVFLLVAISFGANAKCIGEAEIKGRVRDVIQTGSSCRAFISTPYTIQTSTVCPLNEEKLIKEGFEVGIYGGYCRIEPGNRFNGYLVDDGVTIYLE